jgi:hypothetical protein
LKGETTAGNYRYATPIVNVTTNGGNVLLHATDDGTDVFVEKGAVTVAFAGQAPVASSREKIFFSRWGGKVATAERPSPQFISSMPVCFRDVLPSRLSRFAGQKAPEPKRDHDVNYHDVERLFRLPAGLRRGFVERFKPRLQDRDFRQAIEAHITALPEWRPALYPESYKSGAAPTGKSDPR